MIVLVIVAILGTLAAADLSHLRGRYRMNSATRAFAKEVELTRVRAISENREYAIVLVESDPTPLDRDYRDNHGRYEIRSGDSLSDSANWATVADGTYDLADGPNREVGVSIDPWRPLVGPQNYNMPDAIVFGPRGILVNDPVDFEDGVIRVVFRNKESRVGEGRVVRVNMGGGAQIAATE